MHLLRSKLTRLFIPIVVAALGTAACDMTGPQDLVGFYNYAGTVYDSPGRSVNGQLDINSSYGSQVSIATDWNFYEGSQRVVHVVSDGRSTADELSDGTLRWTVTGTLQLSDGSYTGFTLTHEGRRSGSRGLKGTWRLVTDLPSDDSGTFTASRASGVY